jgi:hypothetical protein
MTHLRNQSHITRQILTETNMQNHTIPITITITSKYETAASWAPTFACLPALLFFLANLASPTFGALFAVNNFLDIDEEASFFGCAFFSSTACRCAKAAARYAFSAAASPSNGMDWYFSTMLS